MPRNTEAAVIMADARGKKMLCPKEMQRQLDELIEEALLLLRNKKKLTLVTEETPTSDDLLPWED